MDAKIDRQIPVPPEPCKGATAILRALRIGESVLLPNLHAAALACRIFGAGGYRSHKERGGVRIWRIEVKK